MLYFKINNIVIAYEGGRYRPSSMFFREKELRASDDLLSIGRLTVSLVRHMRPAYFLGHYLKIFLKIHDQAHFHFKIKRFNITKIIKKICLGGVVTNRHEKKAKNKTEIVR
jgi:hypothetical protein